MRKKFIDDKKEKTAETSGKKNTLKLSTRYLRVYSEDGEKGEGAFRRKTAQRTRSLRRRDRRIVPKTGEQSEGKRNLQ